MKKFILRGTGGRWITGNYIGIQIVPTIKMVRNDLEYSIEEDTQMFIIYTDDIGCIWNEKIDNGDQIEFL